MARRYRPRKEYKFWLYHDLPDQVRLMEYIGYLRKTRQFAKVIRNGLRLMWTLGEGDTSVLTELFPGIVQSLKSSTPPPAPDTSNLERRFDQIEQILLSGGAGSPNGMQMLPATTGGTVGGGMGNLKTNFVVQAPTFDDDDDDENTVIIKRDENAGDEITANLVRSFMELADAKPSADAKPINAPRETTKRAPRDDSNLIVKVQVRQ